MSTIDPGTSRRIGDALRARGMDLVDAPVGKTSEHAVTGTLTLELMQEVMRTTMAWNQQFAVAMPKKVFVGDDSPGFAIRLACKDVRLACEAAEAMGFTPLVGRGAHATMERAIEMGKGDRDTAALMFIREKELGIEVRQKAAALKSAA